MSADPEIRTVIHDLNNLFGSMAGYAGFLLEDLPQESRQHRYAASIQKAIVEAQEIVDRLREISGHAKPAQARSQSVQNLAAAAPAGPLHILIVEDQEDMRDMMNLMLLKIGFRVTLCGDPLACVDMLRERPGHFDLVISDQTMPGMTGVELARAIADDFPALPIILMSGFEHEELDEARKSIPSIKDVVIKPIDFGALAQSISAAARPD